MYDKSDMVSPYQLRTEGLDRLLNAREFSKVLIHLAQRRGYQSNSTAEEAKNEKENGIIKSAILENQQRMERGGYRTIGEMMYRDAAFWETINGIRYHCTRNKAGITALPLTVILFFQRFPFSLKPSAVLAPLGLPWKWKTLTLQSCPASAALTKVPAATARSEKPCLTT